MPYNNLDEIPKNTSFLVLLFAVIGALINNTRRKGKPIKQRVLFLLGDFISSSMLCLSAFYLMIGSGYSEPLAVGVAGIVAHQGTRVFFIVEKIIEAKTGAKLSDG